VDSHGFLIVSSGGSAGTPTAFGGGYIILSGGVSESATLSSLVDANGVIAGRLIVSSGGSAIATTVDSGGLEKVSGGGYALSTTVSSGGAIQVYSGGMTSSTTVSSGGAFGAISGSTNIDLNMDPKDAVSIVKTVIRGIIVVGQVVAIVLSDGTDAKADEKIAKDLTGELRDGTTQTEIDENGSLRNDNGQQVNLPVEGNGSSEILGSSFVPDENKGEVNDILEENRRTVVANNDGAIIEEHQLQGIGEGDEVNSAIVQSGGLQIVASGGIANQSQIEGGGQQILEENGQSISAQVNSGGEQDIGSGGIASNTEVNSGGQQNVSSGGVASNSEVQSGGQQSISAGGVASDTEVQSGGVINVSSGGSVVSAKMSGGGLMKVWKGASATYTWAARGASLYSFVTDIVSTQVGTGGWAAVFGGTASNTSVYEGGVQAAVSGALALETILSGGTQHISVGGFASNTVISNGGIEVIGVSGLSIDTIVSSGGSEVVASGGMASQATVSSGGELTVNSGGIADQTFVNDGGIEIVGLGGVASGAVIGSGGVGSVGLGGVTSDTHIQSGGTEIIADGGVAYDTIVDSGGTEIIFAGGTAVNPRLVAGATVLNDGTLRYETPGSVTIAQTISGGGSIEIKGGGTLVLSSGLSAFSGSILAKSGTTLDLLTPDAAGMADIYLQADVDPTIRIHGAALPNNRIHGFKLGDRIELIDFAYDSVASVVSVENGVYTFGIHGLQYTLHLIGLGSHAVRFERGEGNSLALMTDAPPCFAVRTKIATTRGEVAVERLVKGDVVITASGQRQNVQWIGRRVVACHRHPTPHLVWPIRVAAGAFGPGRPRRDVWLSPDHAILFEDVLIPIRCLLNGQNIRRDPVNVIAYYHVELAHHDVLLADGLPAESYLETGARHAFANGGDIVQCHPDFRGHPGQVALHWEARGYAPLVVTGPQVERARQASQTLGGRAGAQQRLGSKAAGRVRRIRKSGEAA
jgi:autotransporter passenger strand-loop-strand repeat protein